jgi:hypothetical protein
VRPTRRSFLACLGIGIGTAALQGRVFAREAAPGQSLGTLKSR